MCTVRTGGDMLGIMLGATVDSDFLAGISADAPRHAEDADDFVNDSGYIGSITIRGVDLGEVDVYLVENSNFSAASIRRASLLNVDTDNGGEPFGFWALDEGRRSGIGSLSIRNTADNQRWFWRGGDEDFDLLDFTARELSELALR
jgi:hypothetical protein